MSIRGLGMSELQTRRDDGAASSVPPRRGLIVDAGLMLLTAALFCLFALYLYSRVDYAVMCRSMDVWFDSDPGRTVSAISWRQHWMHERSNVHPLWSLLITTPFFILSRVMALKAVVTLYVAVQAFVFGGVLYGTLRAFRLGRLDTILTSALFASTAGAWYWLHVPETFVFSAASILIPVLWLALPRGRHDGWSATAQSLISLSITITNWVAGLGAALLAFGWRRAFNISAAAFAIAGALTVVQYRVFPMAGAFFDIWSEENLNLGQPGTFWQHVQVFFVHALAAPDVQTWPVGAVRPTDLVSRFQFAAPDLTLVSTPYLLIWALLIAIGAWAAWKRAVPSKAALLVGGLIAFNFALHSVYGVETFIYAMHFVPLFALVAGWALVQPTRWRIALRGLAIAAVALGMIHNDAKFGGMTHWFNNLDPAVVGYEKAAPCS